MNVHEWPVFPYPQLWSRTAQFSIGYRLIQSGMRVNVIDPMRSDLIIPSPCHIIDSRKWYFMVETGWTAPERDSADGVPGLFQDKW
jgi:hypothetical protein